MAGRLGLAGGAELEKIEVVLSFGMAKLRTQLRGYTGYGQRPSIFDFG